MANIKGNNIEIQLDSSGIEKEFEKIVELVKNLETVFSAGLKKPFNTIISEAENAMKSITDDIGDIMKDMIPNLGEIGLAIGGAALAIEGVIGVVEAWDQASSQRIQEWLKQFGVLSDEQQKAIDKANEWNDKWKELKSQNNNEAAGVLGEYQHTEDLLAELQKITQENGKIKKGYEERAEVITNTLSEALGVEIQIVDGQIVKYGELKDSLEKVVQARKLTALLNVYEEEYTTSLKNQSEQKKQLAENEETLKQLEDEYNQVLRDKVALEKKDYLSQEELTALLAKYEGGLDGARAAAAALKEQVDEQRAVVQESRTTLDEMNTTVGNYEIGMAAAASGGVEEMDRAMLALTDQLKLAETSNEATLTQQVQDFYDAYNEAAEAVKNGSTEITQADLDEKAKMVLMAQAELDKWKSIHDTASTEASEEFIENIDEAGPGSEQATRKVGERSVKAIEEEFTPAVPASEAMGDYTLALQNGGKGAVKAVSDTAKEVNNALAIDTTSKGEYITLGLKRGMERQRGSLLSYASGLAGSVAEELGRALDIQSPSKVTMKLGEYTAEGFAIGIKNEEEEAVKASANLAEESVGKVQSAIQESQKIPMASAFMHRIYAAVAAQTAGSSIYRMALGSNVAKEVAAAQRIDMLQSGAAGQPIYVETHVQLGNETELAVALTPAIEKEMAFRS